VPGKAGAAVSVHGRRESVSGGVLDRGEIDASPMGIPESERRDRSLSGVAMEGAECQSLEIW